MSTSRRHRWSMVAPLLALAGLFGMHGLGDHAGTHGPDVSQHAAMATVDAAAQVVSDAGPGGAGAILVCFGVLLGAAAALLLRRRALRRTPWSLPRATRIPMRVPHSRDPWPPSLTLLCVCRC